MALDSLLALVAYLACDGKMNHHWSAVIFFFLNPSLFCLHYSITQTAKGNTITVRSRVIGSEDICVLFVVDIHCGLLRRLKIIDKDKRHFQPLISAFRL